MTGTLPLNRFSENRFLSAGVNILERCRLSLQASRARKYENEIISCIENSIEEGDTIIDIGSGEFKYLYFMKRKLGNSGKIIAFEFQPSLYQHLNYIKRIFRWKNVDIELIRFYKILHAGNTERIITSRANRAVVLNLNAFAGHNISPALDNYFNDHDIKPRLIKINAAGNELEILQGCVDTLRKYRPTLILKCDQRTSDKQKLRDTFNYLTRLNYTGHFILDTIKVPLTNFDFNMYQNECNDFYCTEFIFK